MLKRFNRRTGVIALLAVIVLLIACRNSYLRCLFWRQLFRSGPDQYYAAAKLYELGEADCCPYVRMIYLIDNIVSCQDDKDQEQLYLDEFKSLMGKNPEIQEELRSIATGSNAKSNQAYQRMALHVICLLKYPCQGLDTSNRRSRADRHRVFLHVAMNKKQQGFVIVNFVLDKGCDLHVGWGRLIKVTQDEMSKRCADIVLENLKGFLARDPSVTFELDGDPSLQRKFDYEHKHVSVDLVNDSMLAISPLQRLPKGGFEGNSNETVQIRLPCNNEEFFRILMNAVEAP